ncbi:GTP cyclohydrolase I, partial [Shewanella sp. 0m-11]
MDLSQAEQVKNALIAKGLETPLLPSDMNTQQKYDRIKGLMTEVISTLGLDLSDDSLCETPHRIAKMYVNEVFAGLDYANFPKIAQIENKMGVDEMVKIS